MSSAGAPNVGTSPIRSGYGFDEGALAQWLEANVPDYRGPLTVEQFNGGQSNPTYKLITPARSYVLRRKPPGALLKGAHAIEREVRVLTALEAVGFPVAHVYGLCRDDRVIGTWFYVMDMVEGRIFWEATIPDVASKDRPLYFDAMNATLAALHKLDPETVGLGDYGKPGNYFARQIGRWSQQYMNDASAGPDPNMDRLVEWLPTHIPKEQDRSSIVHGDFRIDNMIFHPSEPRIIAVLDWELSTLGHPFSDFAYHAMMYRMPPHIVAGLGGIDPVSLNIPSEAEYFAAYCRRMELTEMPGYDFYVAFNFFRLAAIFHGIKGRMIRGNAASAQAAERAALFEELAAIAWAQASKV